MSNDNYKILNSDSGPVVLECESEAAIDKFFNEHKDFQGRNISVVIPEGVTEIGYSAFADCSSLTSITIPDGVAAIGYSAFDGCESLTSITIPGGVTEIGGDTFSYCSSLTSITIPGGVTEIGGEAFSYCSSLTSITIPDGVAAIGYGAFDGCESLTSITIPDGVTAIGDNAFYGCSSLTSVIIPDSVTEIGGWAFCGCSSLTNITIPDGVTAIGNHAFDGCTSLTSIAIPDSVKSIVNYAFRGCLSLTSITIPDGVAAIGYSAFADCSSLTSIAIPDGVAEIQRGAFSDCSSLELVIIPDDPQFNKINDEFNKADFLVISQLPNHVKLIKKSEYYSYVGGEDRFNILSKAAKQILNKMMALSLDDALQDNTSSNKFTPEFKSNLIKDINILAIKNPKDFLSVINSDDRAVALFKDNYEKNQAGFSSSNNSLKTIDGELKKLFYPKEIGGVKIYGFIFNFYSPEISKSLLLTKSISRSDSLSNIIETLKNHELNGVQGKFKKIIAIFHKHDETKDKTSGPNENGSIDERLAKKAKLG